MDGSASLKTMLVYSVIHPERSDHSEKKNGLRLIFMVLNERTDSGVSTPAQFKGMEWNTKYHR